MLYNFDNKICIEYLDKQKHTFFKQCTVFRKASILSGLILTNFRFLGPTSGLEVIALEEPLCTFPSFLASNLSRRGQIHNLEALKPDF